MAGEAASGLLGRVDLTSGLLFSARWPLRPRPSPAIVHRAAGFFRNLTSKAPWDQPQGHPPPAPWCARPGWGGGGPHTACLWPLPPQTNCEASARRPCSGWSDSTSGQSRPGSSQDTRPVAAERPGGAVGSSGRARQPTALDVVPTRPRGLAPDTWPPGQPLRPADLTPPQQEATAQMDSDTLLCVTPHAPNPLATGSPGQSPPPPPCGKDSHSRLYGSLLSLAPLLPSRASSVCSPVPGPRHPAAGSGPPAVPPSPLLPSALCPHWALGPAPPHPAVCALGPVCTAGSRDTWPSGAPTACPVVSVSPVPSSAATQH